MNSFAEVRWRAARALIWALMFGGCSTDQTTPPTDNRQPDASTLNSRDYLRSLDAPQRREAEREMGAQEIRREGSRRER